MKSCRQYSQYFAHNVLLFCLSQDRSKVLPTREHKGLLWSPFVFSRLVTTQHGPPHQCSEIAKFHASNAYSFHILWQKIGPLCRILVMKARMWWWPDCFKLLFFGIFALVTFMTIKKWSFLFKYPSESGNHVAPVVQWQKVRLESDFNNVSPAQWHIEAWGGDCIVRKEMGEFGAGLGSWLNGTLEGSSPLSQVWDVGSGELRAGRMS